MASPLYPSHVSTIFRDIPPQLQKIDAPVSDAEITNALDIRKRFELDAWNDPYMVDLCRAFRLVDGAGVYIEVGTRDKGNLAWLAPKLAPGATMIDVDIDRFEESERRLLKEIGDINYHRITGDSIGGETLQQVRAALGGRQADAIFCDSSHMFKHTLAEFDLYFPLLRSGGVLMYHDCFWEGNESHKGKMQAMQAIDRFVPVYCVYMDEPVHRYVPRSEKTDVWGGVSIMIKP
jgi:predicted O-methyltransferase YrrM